jgi:ketosteroid isomerase-like protein
MMLGMVLVLATASMVFGQEPEDEIMDLESNWAKAVVALDFAALDKMYDNDLIYAHSTGTVDTKMAYMEKLKSGKQKYTAIRHYQSTYRVHGDAAVAHSIVRMKGTGASGAFDNKLLMTHTWIKIDGVWKLVAHQTTDIKK